MLGNSITVESNGRFDKKGVTQLQITSAWEAFDKTKVGDIPYDIGFVTVDDLRKYFVDNGGNHE